jgi:hypothetical protein
MVLESALREVWVRETAHHETKKELSDEVAKNQAPEFGGEIKAAFIGHVEYTQLGNKVIKPKDSVLMLSVSAWNKRSMSPSSIKQYDLQLDVNGQKFRGHRKEGQKPSRLLLEGDNANHIFQMNSSLPALSYLRTDGGQLPFYVPGLQAGPNLKANIELTLIDLLDRPHKIYAQDCPLQYGKLRSY